MRWAFPIILNAAVAGFWLRTMFDRLSHGGPWWGTAAYGVGAVAHVLFALRCAEDRKRAEPEAEPIPAPVITPDMILPVQPGLPRLVVDNTPGPYARRPFDPVPPSAA